MRKSRFEPPGPPDHRLDPYRRAIGRLRDNEELVGLLATRVQIWWTTEGRCWRRRHVDPVELPEWLILTTNAEGQVVGDLFDDGIVMEENLDQELRDWAVGRFRLRGEVLALEWMDGEEADDAWRKCQWF
jgi:hypothetical protein